MIEDVVFRLAEQREKERLTNADAARSWRCYFLSTSNYSLSEFATKTDAQIDDAFRGRFVDIPLPEEGHGIYEDLHGWPNGTKLTDHLKRQCRIYYGIPIREFISKLSAILKRGNDGKLKTVIKKAREQYLSHLRKQPEYSPTLNRASAKFATVYVAGALAIHVGVLNWDRFELREAILKCQLDGLRRPANPPEDSSSAELHKKLLSYLRQNRARFIDLRKGWLEPGEHSFGSVPGYIANHKGYSYFYLTDATLKSIIGSGADASRYKQSLADKKNLALSSGGAGGPRFVVERRIFSGKGKQGLKSVHALKISPVKTSA